MGINHLHRIAWFIGLVLLQALILNNVQVGGYATPFLYIYLLLKFESDVSRNILMLWAFALGLAIDIFSDTLGMNTAAAVLLAFVRPKLLQLFVQRDDTESIVPSVKSMGVAPFIKYVAVAVLLHHAALLSIEQFSTAHLEILLLRVVASSILTVACVTAIDCIGKKTK